MQPTLTCPSCGFTAHVPGGPPDGKLCCPQCQHVFTAPPEFQEDPLAVWVGNGSLPTHTTAPVVGPVVDFSSPEDAASFAAWLRTETKQFNEYVAKQLAVLEERRQQLATRESRVEAALIARQQQLGREWAAASARIESMSRQEASFAEREAALERAAGEQAAREANLTAREGKLPGLALRVAELERREKLLWPIVETLEARIKEAEATEDRVEEIRSALDRHLIAAEQEEKALEQRAAELDDLEERLRQAFEEREHELEALRRSLERASGGEPVSA